jgi:hypothetical protein
MQPNVCDPSDLVRRVERLERQNRWLKVGGGVGLALLGLALLAGGPPRGLAQAEGKAEAPRPLGVRDDRGKERLRLGMGADGPVLTFFDADGKAQAELGMGKTGLALRLIEANGKANAGLGIDRNGVALAFVDKDGTIRTGASAIQVGPGQLILGDNKGQPAAR